MLRPLLALALLTATPALANDSMAELRTGGLVFVRTDAVAMQSEDLSISMSDVDVRYVFRNTTDKDVEGLVAFPMPDLSGGPDLMTAIPDDTSDNFLDFSATVDGKPADVQLEQHAFAAGLEVTSLLREKGVPLLPFGDRTMAALAALPPQTVADWASRGVLFIDTYDVGKGMEDHPTPYWSLKSTYWWRMTFPAGRSITVEHHYKPSVGATAGVNFFEDGFKGALHDEYARRYCMDSDFEQAILRAMRRQGAQYPPFMENRISYVLTTGQNWAGPIGHFRLTLDKGATKNLLSFCGEDVRKTGPTTFEMTADDFYPDKDLDILILQPAAQ